MVVGAYYGKGKRTAVYGAFLLACYDADSEEWQTICKIGTGFSDEALQTHYEALKDLELSKPRGDIKIGGAKPDVWITPKVVWEVLTADLSLSPVYTAAQGLVSASPPRDKLRCEFWRTRLFHIFLGRPAWHLFAVSPIHSCERR